MNAYELRNSFNLKEWNTAITREEFEANFKATKEKVTFTFNGWDGKSYDGESRRGTVYRTDFAGYEGISFINLTARDVVRHPLVQKIVKAYEDYENHGRFEHRYPNRRKV